MYYFYSKKILRLQLSVGSVVRCGTRWTIGWSLISSLFLFLLHGSVIWNLLCQLLHVNIFSRFVWQNMISCIVCIMHPHLLAFGYKLFFSWRLFTHVVWQNWFCLTKPEFVLKSNWYLLFKMVSGETPNWRLADKNSLSDKTPYLSDKVLGFYITAP